VRAIADKLGLATAQRKDSQGICFVGKVHLPTFLQQRLQAKNGNIIEISKLFERPDWIDMTGEGEKETNGSDTGFPDKNVSEEKLTEIVKPYKFHHSSGEIIGTHNGAHFFTIGQRKGMNVGGYKEPLFVIATDVENNIVYVGEGQEHPGLNRKGLFIRKEEIHWIRTDLQMEVGEFRDYLVRIRYRQPLQKARIYFRNKGLYIIFYSLQRGIAPGQFAAWYKNDEVIGSGVIDG
jgi:tRNA-specific 2-thiouridylase